MSWRIQNISINYKTSVVGIWWCTPHNSSTREAKAEGLLWKYDQPRLHSKHLFKKKKKGVWTLIGTVLVKRITGGSQLCRFLVGWFLELRPHYGALFGFEIMYYASLHKVLILLPQPPKCWNFRCMPSCFAYRKIYKQIFCWRYSDLITFFFWKFPNSSRKDGLVNKVVAHNHEKLNSIPNTHVKTLA